MRKKRKANFVSSGDANVTSVNWGSVSEDFNSVVEQDCLANDLYFQPQPLPVSSNSGRIKFSHILFFLLISVLIASNLVASRVVNNTLTWFVLAFSFIAFFALAFFLLRLLYRVGYKKISAFLLLPLFLACAFFGANVAAVVNDPVINESLISEMPSKPQYVFYIHGRNGQPLPVLDESERFVSPAEMWESWFRRAAIAIEDERFETRYEGVIDARAVTRATFKNLWEWNTSEGASGIEIQTAKLLTGHYRTKSYLQKAGQGLIALRLDQRFPFPEEKFCLYGNIVDLVSGKRGVGAAAADLFGTADLRQLTIAQSALLAAMLRNSRIWNPRTKLENTRKRRDLVLGKMRELNFISEDLYQNAIKEEIKLTPRLKSHELLVRAAVNLHKLEKERNK